MGKRGEKMQAEVLSIMRGEKSSLSAYDLLAVSYTHLRAHET